MLFLVLNLLVRWRQDRPTRKNSFQLGTHKETVSTVVDEFVILHNIEFMLRANMGDLGDQTFGV